MSFERLFHHRAMRLCALICLGLLLLAFVCAPIHKHETAQDASCLFCHATAKAEWQLPVQAADVPVSAVAYLIDRYAGRSMTDDAEQTIRIPRAPPA